MTDPPPATARTVRRRLFVWLGASVIGTVVMALPDRGPRVLSFSETHGPSAVDLVGMVVLLAGWLPVVSLLWSKRASLRGGSARLAGSLAVGGIALLALTVGLDLGASWLVAVVVLLTAQLLALREIARS